MKKYILNAIAIFTFATRIWRVTTHGGKRLTERELFAWAHEVWRRGAGEILFSNKCN